MHVKGLRVDRLVRRAPELSSRGGPCIPQLDLLGWRKRRCATTGKLWWCTETDADNVDALADVLEVNALEWTLVQRGRWCHGDRINDEIVNKFDKEMRQAVEEALGGS